MVHTFDETSYLARHRSVAALTDFLKEFWNSWVIRVYAWTSTGLSLATTIVPSISPSLKSILTIGIFSFGLMVSLLFFSFLPKKYIFGLDPDIQDIADLRVVHEGEAIAKKANRCARAHFGKTMGFPYDLYRRWRAKNKFIFTAFLSRSGELIGFADVFPLKRQAAEKVLSGDISEDEIGIDDILGEGHTDSCDHVYIASVVCCVRSSSLAKTAVEVAAFQYIRDMYPPRPGRVYIAVGGTSDGRRVLPRWNFKKLVSETLAKRGRAVYALRSEEIMDGARGSSDPTAIMRIRLLGLQNQSAPIRRLEEA